MTIKTDDITTRVREGRYDLPGGAYDIVETDVTGTVQSPAAVTRRVVTTYRPAYIAEDETVLACCHHAHEVAKAHGAREVMLEHLVHALVRVPEAAQVMADRGINVESLKRESAGVISSEIPVDHTVIVAQLRASKDFNTVMHLAAAAASRRDERQLGARDLLEALLRFDPKSRVVRMIRRHANAGDIEEPVDPLAEVKGLMQRYADEQRDLRLALNELRNAQTGQSSTALVAIDDRMRGMERTLQALATVSGDRDGLSERMKSVHDAILAHRNDTRALADRVQMMERVVSTGGSGDNSALMERLKVVQDSIVAHRNDTRAVADRLQTMERIVSTVGTNPGVNTGQLQTLIGDRFLSMQKTLENHRLDLARMEQSVADRVRMMEAKQLTSESIDGIARRLETVLTEKFKLLETATVNGKPLVLPAGLDTLGDRMQGLERQVSAQRAELQGWQSAIEKDMKTLEDLMDLIPANDGPARPGIGEGEIQGLKQSIDLYRAETQRIERLVEQRLSGLSGLTGLNEKLTGLNGLGDRLMGVERSINTQRTEQSSIRGQLDGDLEQIRKAMMALGNAQQTLSGAIDDWRLNNSGDLSVISNRLASLEQIAAAANALAVAPPVQVVERMAPPAYSAVSNGNGMVASAPAIAAAAVPVPQQTVTQIASSAASSLQSSGLLDRVDRVLAARQTKQ